MLNRNAESMYWMGRYLERAENHVRLIDAHIHLRHSAQDESVVWQHLLETMGDRQVFETLYETFAQDTVLHFLSIDNRWTNSIIACVAKARHNLRNVRDKLPAELWETLNGLHLWLQERDHSDFQRDSTHQFYRQTREKLAAIQGVANAVVPRNQIWHLLESGRCLERAENSTRILNAANGTHESASELYKYLIAVVKSVGGYEAFRRDYLHAVNTTTISEFMLVNETFPRSVLFAMSAMIYHLKRLDQPASNSGKSARDRFLRSIERLTAELSCFDSSEVSKANLPLLLDSLANAFQGIGNAIHHLYFSAKGDLINETRNLSRYSLYLLKSGNGECQ